MNDLLNRLAPAMALCMPLWAMAQANNADPSSAKAVAPPLRYQSAFSDYKPWQDVKPSDWRAVNETVRAAASAGGGHAGHAVPPSAPATPAPARSMPGHSGHQMHGGHK